MILTKSHMAKKDTDYDVDENSSSKPSKKKNGKKTKLKDETRYSIWGIGFIVLGLLVTLSMFKMAGVVGNFIFTGLSGFFGFGYYILPIFLFVIGYSLLKNERPQIAQIHAIFSLTTLLSILGIMDLASNGKGESLNITWGGYLGSIVSWPFLKLFGLYAGILLLGALLIVSLIILFDEKPNLMGLFRRIWSFLKNDIKVPKLNPSNLPLSEEATPPDKEGSGEVSFDETPIKEELNLAKAVGKVKKFETDYIPPPLSL